MGAPKPRNPVARALSRHHGGVMADKKRSHDDDGDDGVVIILVVAAAKNGVIGVKGGLPWHISSDLKYFKRVTMGKPIVMGRKTWMSIGRPLPGRDNIVVTRDTTFEVDGGEVAHSVDDGLALAARRALARGVDEIAIIGGADLYRQTLAMADKIHMTEVDATPEGDAVFPDIDPALWVETAREQGERGPRDDHDFAFVTYERRL